MGKKTNSNPRKSFFFFKKKKKNVDASLPPLLPSSPLSSLNVLSPTQVAPLLHRRQEGRLKRSSSSSTSGSSSVYSASTTSASCFSPSVPSLNVLALPPQSSSFSSSLLEPSNAPFLTPAGCVTPPFTHAIADGGQERPSFPSPKIVKVPIGRRGDTGRLHDGAPALRSSWYDTLWEPKHHHHHPKKGKHSPRGEKRHRNSYGQRGKEASHGYPPSSFLPWHAKVVAAGAAGGTSLNLLHTKRGAPFYVDIPVESPPESASSPAYGTSGKKGRPQKEMHPLQQHDTPHAKAGSPPLLLFPVSPLEAAGVYPSAPREPVPSSSPPPPPEEVGKDVAHRSSVDVPLHEGEANPHEEGISHRPRREDAWPLASPVGTSQEEGTSQAMLQDRHQDPMAKRAGLVLHAALPPLRAHTYLEGDSRNARREMAWGRAAPQKEEKRKKKGRSTKGTSATQGKGWEGSGGAAAWGTRQRPPNTASALGDGGRPLGTDAGPYEDGADGQRTERYMDIAGEKEGGAAFRMLPSATSSVSSSSPFPLTSLAAGVGRDRVGEGGLPTFFPSSSSSGGPSFFPAWKKNKTEMASGVWDASPVISPAGTYRGGLRTKEVEPTDFSALENDGRKWDGGGDGVPVASAYGRRMAASSDEMQDMADDGQRSPTSCFYPAQYAFFFARLLALLHPIGVVCVVLGFGASIFGAMVFSGGWMVSSGKTTATGVKATSSSFSSTAIANPLLAREGKVGGGGGGRGDASPTLTDHHSGVQAVGRKAGLSWDLPVSAAVTDLLHDDVWSIASARFSPDATAAMSLLAPYQPFFFMVVTLLAMQCHLLSRLCVWMVQWYGKTSHVHPKGRRKTATRNGEGVWKHNTAAYASQLPLESSFSTACGKKNRFSRFLVPWCAGAAKPARKAGGWGASSSPVPTVEANRPFSSGKDRASKGSGTALKEKMAASRYVEDERHTSEAENASGWGGVASPSPSVSDAYDPLRTETTTTPQTNKKKSGTVFQRFWRTPRKKDPEGVDFCKVHTRDTAGRQDAFVAAPPTEWDATSFRALGEKFRFSSFQHAAAQHQRHRVWQQRRKAYLRGMEGAGGESRHSWSSSSSEDSHWSGTGGWGERRKKNTTTTNKPYTQVGRWGSLSGSMAEEEENALDRFSARKLSFSTSLTSRMPTHAFASSFSPGRNRRRESRREAQWADEEEEKGREEGGDLADGTLQGIMMAGSKGGGSPSPRWWQGMRSSREKEGEAGLGGEGDVLWGLLGGGDEGWKGGAFSPSSRTPRRMSKEEGHSPFFLFPPAVFRERRAGQSFCIDPPDTTPFGSTDRQRSGHPSSLFFSPRESSRMDGPSRSGMERAGEEEEGWGRNASSYRPRQKEGPRHGGSYYYYAEDSVFGGTTKLPPRPPIPAGKMAFESSRSLPHAAAMPHTFRGTPPLCSPSARAMLAPSSALAHSSMWSCPPGGRRMTPNGEVEERSLPHPFPFPASPVRVEGGGEDTWRMEGRRESGEGDRYGLPSFPSLPSPIAYRNGSVGMSASFSCACVAQSACGVHLSYRHPRLFLFLQETIFCPRWMALFCILVCTALELVILFHHHLSAIGGVYTLGAVSQQGSGVMVAEDRGRGEAMGANACVVSSAATSHHPPCSPLHGIDGRSSFSGDAITEEALARRVFPDSLESVETVLSTAYPLPFLTVVLFLRLVLFGFIVLFDLFTPFCTTRRAVDA